MLTQLEMKVIKLIFETCSRSPTFPILWRNGRATINHEQKLVSKLLPPLLIISISYHLYQLFSLAHKRDIRGSILNGLFILATLACAMLHLNMLIHKSELSELINQVLTLNSLWGKSFLNRQFTTRKIREKIFTVTIGVLCSGQMLSFATLIATRNEPFSLYQLLSNDVHWTTSLLSFALFSLICVVIVLDLAVNLVFHTCACYLSIFSTKFWLQKICFDWSKPEAGSEQPGILKCILCYRGIFILNNKFNRAFGRLILPFIKSGGIIAFILSFFVFVRLLHELDPLFAALVTVATFVIMPILAPLGIAMSTMYDVSKMFHLNFWPNICLVPVLTTKEILKLELKACPLIRCHIGSLYYMEAKAKLTLIQKVVNGVKFTLLKMHV